MNYTDFENEAPQWITVTIDGAVTANMTASAGQDGNFANGEIYQYPVTGAALGPGSHSFQFAASDGTAVAIGDTGVHSGPSVSSPPPPSGGGGGGAVVGEKRITNLMGVIAESGKLLEDIEAPSVDINARLYLTEGTFCRNKAGSFLSSMIVEKVVSPPPAPPDTERVGQVYDMWPDGATFEPAADLVLRYDISLLPEGAAEGDLFIAMWDGNAGEWVRLESTVDPEAGTVSAPVSHFSVFTILAPARPASFTVSDLSLAPEEPQPGDNVAIGVTVTNAGDLAGSYEADLKVDGVVAEIKETTLAGGESVRLVFSLTPDTPGEYNIEVGGLPVTCQVKEPPAPASFLASALSISPEEAEAGETVTIRVTLANTGDLPGAQELSLQIDGARAEAQTIALGGGENREVTFPVVRDAPGTYTVDICGLAGSFVVRAQAALAAEGTGASSGEVVLALTPTPSPLPAPEPGSGGARGLVAGVIAAVVASGIASYWFRRRRRRAAS